MLKQAFALTLASALVGIAHAQQMLGEADLPPNAKPGECYARVLVPVEYKTVNKRVLKQEASEKINVIPANYTTVEEKVLVQEASEEVEVIPAKYETIEQRVLIKEPSERLITEPAQYKTVQETVLVKPAYTTWKKGRGPIERVDNTTGEIMCLVEVPAEYKTVTKQVLERPATTRKEMIPAEYTTVQVRKMVEPPKIRKIAIPAEYKTIQVQKIIDPAKEMRISIPATYETVTERIKVSDSRLLWRPILCETNVTPDIIKSLQAALNRAGYDAGAADGRVGDQTRRALSAYQRDKGLAQGDLTIETLRNLGLNI